MHSVETHDTFAGPSAVKTLTVSPAVASMKDGFIDLIAGTFGGVANVYAGQPLDTVKVKMQTFPAFYPNWVHCFNATYRLDGVRGLYAGTVPALVANIAENAVLFTAYGYCQKAVAVARGKTDLMALGPVENATAGALAAVFAAAVLCPTELVKCRLQAHREVNPKSKCTPLTVCREMWHARGSAAFYVGMSATMIREVPGYFAFFGAYETCRHLLTPPNKTRNDIGLLCTAVSGAVGGMALWTLIYPADVIKSRMQVSGTGQFLPMFRRILREEGVKALYKGLSPTLIRTCAASACLFIAYENTKSTLHGLF